MNTPSPNLSQIYNFRSLGDHLGTAGQPTAQQLQSVRDAGFQAVINLALPTSDNALPNEDSLVTSLGMAYVHIPVDFESPTPQDFSAFCRVMDAFHDRPVFVHCAANMRVSAFLFLYRVLHQNVAIANAERDLHAIWHPDEVWTKFIQTQLRQPNHSSPPGNVSKTATRNERMIAAVLKGQPIIAHHFRACCPNALYAVKEFSDEINCFGH